MATTATSVGTGESWLETYRRNAYYLKPTLIVTLITGIYLHLSVVFLGHDIVVEHIATPTLDQLLAIPMTYAAIVSWIVWRRVVHPSRWHRFVYGVLAVYFTISIPFHVRTFVTGNTEIFKKFPVWYSVILLPYLVGLLVFSWRLRFRES